jgi:hypothetical protein
MREIENHRILEFEKGKEINFEFEAYKIRAFENETVAIALYRNGIDVFSESSALHRPRGILCAIGKIRRSWRRSTSTRPRWVPSSPVPSLWEASSTRCGDTCTIGIRGRTCSRWSRSLGFDHMVVGLGAYVPHLRCHACVDRYR